MSKTVIGALAMALLAVGAFAQEEEKQEDRPRPHLQVLQDPHEIASFYRSSQSYDNFVEMRGPVGIGDAMANRYPIASFYRARAASPYGYSRFWTGGSSPNGYSRFWTTGYAQGGYARVIGRNGDLFFFAPTFLAPMGPLAGAFFEAR
jgi:hypothetical protein